MSRSVLCAVCLAAAAAIGTLAGCGGGGGGGTTEGPSGRAVFTVNWPQRSRVDLGPAASIKVEVLASGRSAGTQVGDRPAADGLSTVEFAGLPAGEAEYHSTAYTGAGAAGSSLGECEGIVAITSGGSSSVTLCMHSPVADLALSSPPDVLKPGAQVHLLANARGSAGQSVFVAPGRVSWHTDAPLVATVDTNTGVVTGVGDGQASISATESETGITRATAVTVGAGAAALGRYVVFGYNDLGMHCMNQDFSEFMILPPYNTLHAQVVNRSGEEPHIVTSGVQVTYTVPGNTYSVGKTNFWTFARPLLGATLAPNVGLSGNRLAGSMKPTGTNDWAATGIPITPLMDNRRENAYPLALVRVLSAGQEVARTQAVVPVSWEISCNLCHNTPGISPATDILRKHDRLHATTLERQKPVLCGKCHAQPPLGLAGQTGRHSLSRAMHGSHATRMSRLKLATPCYACHPGIRTKCMRDVHYSRGMTCTTCHGQMATVAGANRRPWVDEPRCDSCHHRAGSQYEQAGTLYRNSKGHQGIHCAACHGSPHAITPTDRTITNNDNVQAIALQGAAGTIRKCTVCHRTQPDDAFPHRFSGEGDEDD